MRGSASRVGRGCAVWIGTLAVAVIVYSALGVVGLFVYRRAEPVGAAAIATVAIVTVAAVIARRAIKRGRDEGCDESD